MLYRRVEIQDGESVEPVQFVGVYALNWGGERGPPTVAFVEDEEASDKLDAYDTLIRLAHRLAVALTYHDSDVSVETMELLAELDSLV